MFSHCEIERKKYKDYFLSMKKKNIKGKKKVTAREKKKKNKEVWKIDEWISTVIEFSQSKEWERKIKANKFFIVA